jgi:hypothetical protein
MDLDMESLGSGENKKRLMIGGALLAVIIIILLAATQLTPRTMTASFSQAPIRPGTDTTLTVSLQNLEKYDAENVVVSVIPESNKISVLPPTKTETIIGAGARRDLSFKVLAQTDATPGSYRIEISTEIGEKPVSTNVYLEVKTQ